MNPNIWGRTLVNMKQKPQFLNQTSHSLLRMNRMDQIPFGWFKGQFTGTTYLLKGKNPLVSSFRRKKKTKTNQKKLRFAQQVPDFLPLLRDFRRHRLDSRLWAAADLHLGEHEPREQKHARLLLQLFVQPMLALEDVWNMIGLGTARIEAVITCYTNFS
jgi:hypothetical protein